ncbi:MAG: YesL family protein, partial [Lachnospiraceae bacterium]|nr:YesL family protein [Lachnospiraceae bacterium]
MATTRSNIFDPEGPLSVSFNTVKDLITLNLITIVFCLPVVTIGASLTAMHYTALKMVRDEEGYITKTFFKSFK